MSVDRSRESWHPPATVHPSQLHTPPPPGCESPVPEFAKRTPGELLDSFYTNRREPDWTDVLPKQLEVHLNHPRNVGARVGSSGLVGRWPRPNGLAAVPVPVDGAGLTLDKPQFVVEFKNVDRAHPSKGVHMVDVYRGNMDPLEGARDVVFHGLGKRELRFVIAWPGYRPSQFTVSTIAGDGRPLTRFDLGEEITLAYASFFRRVETERQLPSQVGFYNIALHQGSNMRPDSLGVQIFQLHIVRVRGTIGGNWATDVDIV